MASGYQLKITVKNSHPPIWRRVIVPENITFYDLDNIIEEMFGWEHNHMFSFDFKWEEISFIGTPIPDPEDTADECIDDWVREGETFSYIYDFGDHWEHTIKVEKVVAYDKRYPVVLKYKGPNMIEDCGGIWEFENCRDVAEDFDMEEVNARFAAWDIPITVSEFSKEEEEEMLNRLQRMLGEFTDNEEAIRECTKEIDSLKDVFCCYTKENLKNLARAHGFSRFNSFKKEELAEWLKNHLLDTQYMERFFMHAGEDEYRLFAEAVEQKGIVLSKEIIAHSLLLSSYGGYLADVDFFQIPLDVQKAYQKVITPEFQERFEERVTFSEYCEAANYLYGVLPIAKFTELYNSYEQKELTEEETAEKIRELICDGEPYVLENGYFMDEQLAEQNLYQHVLEISGQYTYYLPEASEEFLVYGQEGGESPNENTKFFLDYLMKTEHMKYPKALMAFYEVQEGIRMNAEDVELLEMLEECGCSFDTSGKVRKMTEQLIKLGGYVRKWDYRGHTSREIKQEPQKPNGGKGKIVPFAKKVYPNDPCPCGSGKKYKHCCGKKS